MLTKIFPTWPWECGEKWSKDCDDDMFLYSKWYIFNHIFFPQHSVYSIVVDPDPVDLK